MKIVYVTIFLINHALFSMSVPEKLIRIYCKDLTIEAIGEIYNKQTHDNDSSACHERITEELVERIIAAKLKKRESLFLPEEETDLLQYGNKLRKRMKLLITVWGNKANYEEEKERLKQADFLEQQKQKHRADLELIRENNERTIRMIFEHSNRIRALLEAEMNRCSRELAKSRKKLLQLHDETRRKRMFHEQNYQCPVCLVPMKKAKVSRSCSDSFHLFCISCSDTLIAAGANCPVCRAPNFSVFRQEIETPLKFLDEVP
jgi:hypothetical protein